MDFRTWLEGEWKRCRDKERSFDTVSAGYLEGRTRALKECLMEYDKSALLAASPVFGRLDTLTIGCCTKCGQGHCHCWGPAYANSADCDECRSR